MYGYGEEGDEVIAIWTIEGDEGQHGYSIRLCRVNCQPLVWIGDEPFDDQICQKCLTIIGYCAFYGHLWRCGDFPGSEELVEEYFHQAIAKMEDEQEQARLQFKFRRDQEIDDPYVQVGVPPSRHGTIHAGASRKCTAR